jgi:hypothetical protein
MKEQLYRQLSAEIVEQEDAAIFGQRRSKYVSAVTNQHTTIKERFEVVFSVFSALRLFIKDQGEKIVSWRWESAVSSF